jgi:hypothetical protein
VGRVPRGLPGDPGRGRDAARRSARRGRSCTCGSPSPWACWVRTATHSSGPASSPSTTRPRSRCGSASVRSWRAPTPTPPGSPGSRPPTWWSTATPPSTSWATGRPATWPPRSGSSPASASAGRPRPRPTASSWCSPTRSACPSARPTASRRSTGCASPARSRARTPSTRSRARSPRALDSDMSLYNAYLQSAASRLRQRPPGRQPGARHRRQRPVPQQLLPRARHLPRHRQRAGRGQRRVRRRAAVRPRALTP